MASWTCPITFSNGPCFTSAKNWTEAQRTCEQHGSNLATIVDAGFNAQLGQGGCFSAAPWNGWQCTWVGLTDLRAEGNFEWASGVNFSYANWGRYEPDTTSGNQQDCAAVCHGGSIDGYTGDFWVDLECSSEYTFCCDPATFSRDSGTPAEDSFLASLAAPASHAAPPSPPPLADPNPYADRRICFSTQLTWSDAQLVCESMGSNLITIHNEAELDHLGRTVHYSRVPDSWGLDWQCVWAGFHDQREEGSYEWVSRARPGFTPAFGPFEAGNGDGAEEDCVALCKSACANGTAPCTDLAEYGYVGNFAIDTTCNDEYAFCCDGLAATFVASARATDALPPPAPPPEKDGKDAAITILAVVATIAVLTAIAAVGMVLSLQRAKSATPTLKAISAASGVAMTSSMDYSPPVQPEGKGGRV